MGSTLAARRAGTYAASSAIAIIATAPATIGTALLICNSGPGSRQTSRSRRHRCSHRQTDTNHAQRVSQHHPGRAASGCAQGHANADLVGASRHHVRQQSIEADGRQQCPQHAEPEGQRGHKPLRNDGRIHLIGQRSDTLDGDCLQEFAHRTLRTSGTHSFRINTGPKRKSRIHRSAPGKC